MSGRNTTSIGRQAEDLVVDELMELGHKITIQNWRTKNCEVDIISRKDNVVYFTEVKYRASAAYGGGFEAVTKTKLKQMKFAAKLWVFTNRWSGDYRLLAVSVNGQGNIDIRECT